METGQQESGEGSSGMKTEENSAVEAAVSISESVSSAALSSLAVESAPPTPTSVPPATNHQFTSEDTIKLDTSQDRKDDDLSLIVHVDESQNDLDNDLDQDKKAAATPVTADTTDETATEDKMDTKPEEEVEDSSEEKKPEGTAETTTPATGDQKDDTSAPTPASESTATAGGDKTAKRFVYIWCICIGQDPSAAYQEAQFPFYSSNTLQRVKQEYPTHLDYPHNLPHSKLYLQLDL